MNLRLLIWIFFVLLSGYFIFGDTQSGYEVYNSTIKEIPNNTILLSLDGEIPNQEKIYKGLIEVKTNNETKFVEINGYLPFRFEAVSNSGLQFGLDIKGGISVLLNPKDQEKANELIPVLEERINLYGLRDADFRLIQFENKTLVEVSISGGDENEIKDLLERQGKFSGKIPIEIISKNGNYELKLNESYEISEYGLNETFSLEGIEFKVIEKTDEKIVLESIVFTGEDIITVYNDPQRSRLIQNENGYGWESAIKISNAGAEKFATITEIIPISFNSQYLDSNIFIYLDDDLINDFNISSNLKGNVQTDIVISGFGATFDEAVTERLKLSTILRSGDLPTSVEIVQTNIISPTLGSDFTENALQAGLIGILGVSLIIIIRYRNPLISFSVLVFSLSEVFIILGILSVLNVNIDLPAIAGIIAAIGTGIDSQLIILDNIIKKKEESIKERLRKAFFIVFGAGGITIAAMTPLILLGGVSVLRGFAITTIIGVLIGIFISRPAFGQVISKIIKD